MKAPNTDNRLPVAIYDRELLKEAIERRQPRIIIKGALAGGVYRYAKIFWFFRRYRREIVYGYFVMFLISVMAVVFGYAAQFSVTVGVLPLSAALSIFFRPFMPYRIAALYEPVVSSAGEPAERRFFRDDYLDIVLKTARSGDWRYRVTTI